MDDMYNLTGLGPPFQECRERDERTLAFELRDGKGRFVFLMFFLITLESKWHLV